MPCDDPLGDVMQTLLTAARNQLIACGRDVGQANLEPGQQVAWDNCCAGQLWVRIISITPNPVDQVCDINSLNVMLGIGTIRCAHTQKDDGTFPTDSELTADTRNTTQDAQALLNAIRCTTFDARHVNRKGNSVVLGTPLGALGGCAGWEWQYRVSIIPCGTC